MATNFFPYNGAVKVALSDDQGNADLVRCTVANIPSGVAGYAISCILQATDIGAAYINTGTTASATFTLLDSAGSSLTLPAAATDATTTSGNSLALTQNTVTTGKGLVQSLNGLTTGFGHSITHTTSVISGGGTLLNLSSTGVDTTTTSGALVTLTATLGVAATQVLGTFGTTTGIGVSLVTDALTTGQSFKISSSATAITTTGRLFLVSHSGATGTSGILSEITSAATDETVIFQVTASAALAAGKVLNLSAAAVTTGTVLSAANADALTTGSIGVFTSNSADVTARRLVQIINDNTAAVATVPLYIQQDAVGTTHFKTLIILGTFGLYTSDETTPNGALSAAKGSICLNGSATGQAFWNTDGATAWTALQ